MHVKVYASARRCTEMHLCVVEARGGEFLCRVKVLIFCLFPFYFRAFLCYLFNGIIFIPNGAKNVRISSELVKWFTIRIWVYIDAVAPYSFSNWHLLAGRDELFYYIHHVFTSNDSVEFTICWAWEMHARVCAKCICVFELAQHLTRNNFRVPVFHFPLYQSGFQVYSSSIRVQPLPLQTILSVFTYFIVYGCCVFQL